FEDSHWRALTSYDPSSVMHYPWCNGTNTGDLYLTELDKLGARLLYGPPSGGGGGGGGKSGLLFINTSGGGGRVMVTDLSHGAPPAEIEYLELWGASDRLDGWHDSNDLTLVG